MSGSAGSYNSSIFSFFEEPPYYFPQWLDPFTFPPTVCECSLFCTSLPTLAISSLFDNSYSNICKVISHCGFHLPFPDD